MISIIPTYNLEVLEHAVGSLDNLTPDYFSELTDMLTDLYWYCTHSYAEMLSNQGVTVYQYMFSYKGSPVQSSY